MPPLPRLSNRLLLTPADLEPSRPDFRVVGVLNPGVAVLGGDVILLARVMEAPVERRPGFAGLVRWTPDRGTIVEWVAEGDLLKSDPRTVVLKSGGNIRLTFTSYLAAFRSRDGRSGFSRSGGLLLPAGEMEEFGVEDARITALDGRYYVTYVCASRHGAATALASTSDFATYERHGVIFPPENKGVMLFPAKIGGEYVALHRPVQNIGFHSPEMWISSSPDLVHWGRHRHLLGGEDPWNASRIGGGAPPVRFPEGWLAIYHGAGRPGSPGDIGVYAAGTLLLDPADPAKVLGRSPGPVMVPEAEFETGGFVSNVVFPTGTVDAGDNLLVYYGCADTSIAVAEFSKHDLMHSVNPWTT